MLTNFITQSNSITVNDLSASFRNCIFWGEENGFVKDEVVTLKQGNTNYSVLFDNVLWRMQASPASATVSGATLGTPLFDSNNTAERFYSFRPKEGSPAINAGTAAGVQWDLDGKPRPAGSAPDLGAYEWRP